MLKNESYAQARYDEFSKLDRNEILVIGRIIVLSKELGFTLECFNRAAQDIMDINYVGIFPYGKKSVLEKINMYFNKGLLNILLKENEQVGFSHLKTSEKIHFLLLQKFLLFFKYRLSMKRYFASLLNPFNLGLYKQIIYRDADFFWLLGKDQSVDENYFSKRLILSTIIHNLIVKTLVNENIFVEDLEKIIWHELALVGKIAKTKAAIKKIIPDHNKIIANISKIRFGC